MKKTILFVLILSLCLTLPLAAQAGKPASAKTKIVWWTHGANETAKRSVIETIVADYMASHPNVEIELVWWDKKQLQEAWRTSMTARSGAPDIVTDAESQAVQQVKAGWFLDLGPKFPWGNLYPEAKTLGAAYEGVDGYYTFRIGRSHNMILYNKAIFAELGIVVPPDYTFTADQMVEIVKKGAAKGYAGVANAIGNRPTAASYLTEWPLLSKVGFTEYVPLRRGKASWNAPAVREVLSWGERMRDAGLWPPTFSTMTIDEFHVYFHTQRKAMMFWVPTWYTGRAFAAVADGGQDPSFQFGMLRYPRFPGSKGEGIIMGSFESGYCISSATKSPDLCRDILAFAAQPKYGALWELKTDGPSTIKYAAKDIPAGLSSKWAWYHEERNKVYGPLKLEVFSIDGIDGNFANAFLNVTSQGIPLKLMTVDQAIKTLDAVLVK